MDAPLTYSWGNYTQHLSSRQIATMKKNMKKVPVIQLKSDIYHKTEEQEAENILENIPHTHPSTVQISPTTTSISLKNTIQLLRKRFISLF